MRVPISRTRLGLEALITSSRIFPFSGPITGMKFRSPILSIALRTASALSICRLPSRGDTTNTVSGTPESVPPRQSFIAARAEKGENRMSTEQVDLKEVQKQISRIVDPEVGVPIVEMNLIDKLEIKEGLVDVQYHATTQYCPPVFALKISQDIKTGVMGVKGVKDVHVVVTGHYFAEAINRQVNKPPATTAVPPQETPKQ